MIEQMTIVPLLLLQATTPSPPPASTGPSVQGFIDPSTIVSYGVATVAVWAVYNVFRSVFKRNSTPVLFLASALVGFGIPLATNNLTTAWWFFAFLNSCLLFCSTVGMQEAVVNGVTVRDGGTIEGQSGRVPKLLESWLPKRN